jgi:acyl-CoA dehydrogenase
MDSHIYPAEKTYEQQREELVASGQPHVVPPVLEDLKSEAKNRGLWNLFLPDVSGLTNLEYAHLAEIMGRSGHLAPEATNCAAPDTGNMEVLHMFGTPEQKERWLRPLMDGEIRSAFAMTEPAVASSDATNISTEIRRDGDDYVINGRKWWISGAADPRCAVFILMGRPILTRRGTASSRRSSCRWTRPASRSSATCSSSVMSTSTGTARSSSTTCVCPRPT